MTCDPVSPPTRVCSLLTLSSTKETEEETWKMLTYGLALTHSSLLCKEEKPAIPRTVLHGAALVLTCSLKSSQKPPVSLKKQAFVQEQMIL